MCLALVAAWQSRNNSVTGTKPMWVCTYERGYVCVRTLYEGGFIISWAEGHLALIGVLRCWFWCLQHWCCLLLGIRSWLPPPPSTFPPFCFSPSAPQLIPRSLRCYRSAFAAHQRAKKSSPFLLPLVILFPLYLFIICSLFPVPFPLRWHPTYCYFLIGNYVSAQGDEKAGNWHFPCFS